MTKSRGKAKSIARASRQFKREQRRWNNILADGDWQTSDLSSSVWENDEIIHFGGDNFRDAISYEIDFDALSNGHLTATRTAIGRDGVKYSADYVGTVDPWNGDFVLSGDSGHMIFGSLSPDKDALTLRLVGAGQWDDQFVATIQLVDVS